MKFLVDESLGVKISHFLVEKGFDSISISEELSGAVDTKVLAKAKREKRVLITNDKDFGYLVFQQKLTPTGVILLRLRDESITKKIEIINNLLKNYSHKIKGNFIVLTDESIRIRKI